MAGPIVREWTENSSCFFPGCPGSNATHWAEDADGNRFVKGNTPCSLPHVPK